MERLPEKTSADTVHALMKGIASLLPTIGGPLAVMLETVFSPPIERRREKWLRQLGEVLAELEQRVASLSALSNNELFITVALQATKIAYQTHQDEKLHALRNAVLHAGLPDGPDELLQLMCLRFVEELTPVHLTVLALFDDPVRWMERHNVQSPGWSMGGPSTVMEHCIPNLQGRREIYEQLVRDLQTRGLLHQGPFLNITMTGRGMVESRTTKLGKACIAFVSADP